MITYFSVCTEEEKRYMALFVHEIGFKSVKLVKAPMQTHLIGLHLACINLTSFSFHEINANV